MKATVPPGYEGARQCVTLFGEDAQSRVGEHRAGNSLIPRRSDPPQRGCLARQEEWSARMENFDGTRIGNSARPSANAPVLYQR